VAIAQEQKGLGGEVTGLLQSEVRNIEQRKGTLDLRRYYPSRNSLHNYARGICHHRGEHISEPKLLSRDFPEASGRLLRNLKEFTFQDMAN